MKGDRVAGVTEQLLARDGRALRVLERGDRNGRPVLVHSGTPNSRLLFDRDVARAERQGIRLISYDRPGYGGSTRQRDVPWPTTPRTFVPSQRRWRSSDLLCGGSPGVVRIRWRARRCCPISCRPSRCWPLARPGTPRDLITSPAWARWRPGHRRGHLAGANRPRRFPDRGQTPRCSSTISCGCSPRHGGARPGKLLSRIKTAWLGWMTAVGIDMLVLGGQLFVGMKIIGLSFAMASRCSPRS